MGGRTMPGPARNRDMTKTADIAAHVDQCTRPAAGRAIGYSGIRASATSRVAWRSRAAPISALTACT